MAKFGEGDPRWLVEKVRLELAVLCNSSVATAVAWIGGWVSSQVLMHATAGDLS